MIAYLQGTILSSTPDKAIILTQVGIGYDVHTVSQLQPQESVELYISTIFREAGTELFAFTDLNQKALFEFLLQVNGVGPKSAFSIIKNLGPSKIINAILEEDEATLKSIPGVGSKTAKQIILDLKTKIEKDPTLKGMLSASTVLFSNNEPSSKNKLPNNVAFEIRSALKELGFKDQEIQKKFYQYQYREGLNADQILKDMLKN
jgi:Holliday junction DNA helicase RuvA